MKKHGRRSVRIKTHKSKKKNKKIKKHLLKFIESNHFFLMKRKFSLQITKTLFQWHCVKLVPRRGIPVSRTPPGPSRSTPVSLESSTFRTNVMVDVSLYIVSILDIFRTCVL